MRILITGGTGLIGKRIAQILFERGHDLVILARHASQLADEIGIPVTLIDWDLSQAPPKIQDLEGIEAVIHLAGVPVGESRWTEKEKRKIYDSRVQGTKHLFDSLIQIQPKTVISASAIGLYRDDKGQNDPEWITETSSVGSDFLAEVVQDWEAESLNRSLVGTRQVVLRIGIVMGKEGGALKKLIPVYLKGLGGPLDGGKQWMSWVHVDDVAHAFCHALETPSMEGPYNVVAPNPVRQEDFAKLLGKALHQSASIPTPAFAIQLVYGQMAEMVLSSQKISSQKLVKAGFHFKHPELLEALSEICQNALDHDIHSIQMIPKPLHEVFQFFSSAENLAKITPPEMQFKIVKKSTAEIENNTLIDYTLKVHGIPISWRTRIENWNPPHEFVDTQLKGPYSLWHHTHTFRELTQGRYKGKTLMIDHVRYRLPGGALGDFFLKGQIKKDTTKIFKFRRETILKIFS